MSQDLFGVKDDATRTSSKNEPLASRIRPTDINDIIGQDHILGDGKLLRRAIQADKLGSIILYGPPGCGKTSLAEAIARATSREFERTSGVLANVEILRGLIKKAAHRLDNDAKETILFIDEIHRFNKAQQDILLPHVEKGTVTLIGATTHNPMFFINSPLVSRSIVFELKPLTEQDIVKLANRALTHPGGLSSYNVKMDADAIDHLARSCDGDARRALNAIEIAVCSTEAGADGVVHVSRQVMEDSMQKKAVLYDHDEDGHYDTISAFIKSMRGSDPHAAVYWLAKMIYAGEDPRFIARRLVIFSSEDVGNADPRGLTIAVSAMHAVEFVGMPEARIILAHAATYLATAPKSNASYLAVEKALADIKDGRTLKVPEQLKNVKIEAQGKEKGSDYLYPHDFEGHFVDQEYIPTLTKYYFPTDIGYEETISKRMAQWVKQRKPRAKGDNG